MGKTSWMGALFGAAVVVGTAVGGVALADKDEATSCLRIRVGDDYGGGWALRTLSTVSLDAGEHQVYRLRLLAGNEYRIQACGDAAAVDVDIVVHDEDGNELTRDKTDDARPRVDFKPDSSETYMVAVYVAQVKPGASDSAVAFGVSYR